MNGIRGASIVAILLLSACGGGGGSSGGPVGPSGPAVLESISVTPDTLTLGPGSIRDLACMGQWSDGRKVAEPATWTCSSPLVLLSETVTMVPSIRASWKGEGSATITVKSGGFEIAVPVTLKPLGAWTLYAADDAGRIYAYPAGGGDPVVKYTAPTGMWGFAADADAGNLYYMAFFPVIAGEALIASTTVFHKVSTTTWVDEAVATFDSGAGGRCFGLDVDRDGKLWTLWADGLLYINPEDGSTNTVQVNAAGWQIDVACGPDGGRYMTPLGFGEPYFLLRQAGADSAYEWGTDHLLAGNDPGSYGYVTAGGVAFNNTGDAFVLNSCSNILVRYHDIDGDGACTGEGECTLFAEIFPAGADVFMSGPLGVAVAPDGTILVNCYEYPGLRAAIPWVVAPNDEGIWAFKDLNHDGDALDENERWRFSDKPVICECAIDGIRLGRGW